MAYTPNTWKNGDVVTSSKLNNLEQGVAAAGALYVHYSDLDSTPACDKTFAQINAAIAAGTPVIAVEDLGDGAYSYYALYSADSNSIVFTAIGFGILGMSLMKIEHFSDGTITPETYEDGGDK